MTVYKCPKCGNEEKFCVLTINNTFINGSRSILKSEYMRDYFYPMRMKCASCGYEDLEIKFEVKKS